METKGQHLAETGREANRRLWAAFFTALPDLSATMEDFVRSIDIWRVEDGMFAEHWDELNLMEMLLPCLCAPAGQEKFFALDAQVATVLAVAIGTQRPPVGPPVGDAASRRAALDNATARNVLLRAGHEHREIDPSAAPGRLLDDDRSWAAVTADQEHRTSATQRKHLIHVASQRI